MLIVAFILFILGMAVVLVTNQSMIWALLFGLVMFTLIGLKKLNMKPAEGIKELAVWSWSSIKDSLVVIEVMFVIGFITAAWRVSGTITVFVYYGMKIIVPPLFLIVAFLLSCLLSYALGTSFGVAGTLGVIFMALARSGGVNPAIAAGVIISGIYFGDRASPVSSSANMVAGITGTDILTNVKLMMKTGILPFTITLVAYIAISFFNPISHIDESVIKSFEESFTLSPWSFVPAVIMLLLPLVKVGIIPSIIASVISSVVVGCFVEKVAFLDILKTLIFGYNSLDNGLGAILNGGGMLSMMEVVIILSISCAYSGIFNRTDMLKSLLDKIEDACSKLGRFQVTLLVSLLTSMIFCNQTIASLMCNDLLTKPYENTGGSRQELAIDMENTVIIVVGLVPWAIACTVPLTFLGVGMEALPWAAYLYLVPLCYIFTKGRWFENKASF